MLLTSWVWKQVILGYGEASVLSVLLPPLRGLQPSATVCQTWPRQQVATCWDIGMTLPRLWRKARHFNLAWMAASSRQLRNISGKFRQGRVWHVQCRGSVLFTALYMSSTVFEHM